MAKYIEYAVFVRDANDHNPSHWKQLGKAKKSLDLLREIMQPDDIPNGVAWRDGDLDFKIMQRSVSTSEWRTTDVGTSSFKRYG